MLFDISMPMPSADYLATALQLLQLRTLYGYPPQNYLNDYGTRVLQNDVAYPFLVNYDAVCNLVGHAYTQLEKAYPDAKFLLVDWNAGDWLLNTRTQLTSNDHSTVVANSPMAVGQINRLLNFGCLHTDDDNYLLAQLAKRKADVVAYFADKPDKLLVMQPTDGWDVLCPFLGNTVPGVAFPTPTYQKVPAAGLTGRRK